MSIAHWADGYCKCINDMRKLMRSRGDAFPARYHALFDQLTDDLIADAALMDLGDEKRQKLVELREEQRRERDERRSRQGSLIIG